MLRLILFVAIATLVSGQEAQEAKKEDGTGSAPDTRLFGNLIGGALGALGGAVGGALQGGQQGLFGQQQRPPFQQQNPFGQQQNPFGQQQFPGQNPFQPQNPFGQQQFPGQNPFQPQNPFGQQQFPGQQFPVQNPFQPQPVVPTGSIPVGQALVNPGIADNRPVVQGVSATCRRWCQRFNEQTRQTQAFCCERADEAQSTAAVKGGVCPPKRPSCPPLRFLQQQGPRRCSSDGGCAGVDKCCNDECLQMTICKPPQGVGK